jgi:hypothetical protein
MPGRNFGIQKRNAHARPSQEREIAVNTASPERFTVKIAAGFVAGNIAAKLADHVAEASVSWLTEHLPGWFDLLTGAVWVLL